MPHSGQVVFRGISIHVLREEDDVYVSKRNQRPDLISIHVLREEDDGPGELLDVLFVPGFLSTSSARRTTLSYLSLHGC